MDSSQEERVDRRGTMYPERELVSHGHGEDGVFNHFATPEGFEGCPVCNPNGADFSPEPDTVAEEQLEALRRENERFRAALEAIRDGQWSDPAIAEGFARRALAEGTP